MTKILLIIFSHQLNNFILPNYYIIILFINQMLNMHGIGAFHGESYYFYGANYGTTLAKSLKKK